MGKWDGRAFLDTMRAERRRESGGLIRPLVFLPGVLEDPSIPPLHPHHVLELRNGAGMVRIPRSGPLCGKRVRRQFSNESPRTELLMDHANGLVELLGHRLPHGIMAKLVASSTKAIACREID